MPSPVEDAPSAPGRPRIALQARNAGRRAQPRACILRTVYPACAAARSAAVARAVAADAASNAAARRLLSRDSASCSRPTSTAGSRRVSAGACSAHCEARKQRIAAGVAQRGRTRLTAHARAPRLRPARGAPPRGAALRLTRRRSRRRRPAQGRSASAVSAAASRHRSRLLRCLRAPPTAAPAGCALRPRSAAQSARRACALRLREAREQRHCPGRRRACPGRRAGRAEATRRRCLERAGWLAPPPAPRTEAGGGPRKTAGET